MMELAGGGESMGKIREKGTTKWSDIPSSQPLGRSLLVLEWSTGAHRDPERVDHRSTASCIKELGGGRRGRTR
jgi:hypothetical protein